MHTSADTNLLTFEENYKIHFPNTLSFCEDERMILKLVVLLNSSLAYLFTTQQRVSGENL